jgi:hypothetical protein
VQETDVNGLKRLAKLGLVLVLGSYLVGCVIAPHGGWGHGHHSDHGGYSERGGERGGYSDRGGNSQRP